MKGLRPESSNNNDTIQKMENGKIFYFRKVNRSFYRGFSYDLELVGVTEANSLSNCNGVEKAH